MKFELFQQFIFSFCIVSVFIIKNCLCSSSCTYIKVESAGKYDETYVNFTINGVVYFNTSRRFNILALDSSTLSTITASDNFDTCGDSGANT